MPSARRATRPDHRPDPTLPHDRLLRDLEHQAAHRSLAARLSLAAARSRGPAASLEALARLDPAQALEWMREAGEGARAAVPEASLRRALALVADAAREHADPALADLAAEAAAALPDLVTPETAAALAAGLLPERRGPVLGPLVRRLLDRAPADPRLLRVAAALALDSGDAPAAHALLTRLGRADPSPATVQWAARARAGLPEAPGPRARVALLSSYTLDPLVPFLDVELRAAGVVPQAYVAPFGAWEREVIDPGAGLRAFGADAVFLAVSVDDLVPALATAAPLSALEEAGDEAVERLAGAVAALRAWSAAPVVVHSLHSAHPDPGGPAAAREGRSRGAWLARLNAALAGRLADFADAYLLDLGELLARRPDGAAEDPKLRHLARMRLGPRVLPEVAAAWAGYVVPLKGLTRKCVVVDLDGTLWGGVVGEDGPAGIRLGDTSPGSEYVELQRALAGLAARGILLAAVSKNNEADALEAIRGHDAMVLREDDFAAMRLNWLPKHENVRAVAAELGIGTDSLVFLDDNPDERELMRQMLPEVLTPDLPADPARYRETLERLPQLRVLRATDEDRERAGLYRARRRRETARAATRSMDEFLRSLDLWAHVEPAAPAELPRVAQLFARTNQFNLTTRRHDAARLSEMAVGPAWRLFALRAGDRFSDHGLVGAAAVRAGEGTWRVESLLLSCRAIGFGLETALLSHVAAAARRAGAARLEGEFAATEKNRPAAGFWARHGFTLRGPEDGVEVWERAIAGEGVPFPAWITGRSAG